MVNYPYINKTGALKQFLQKIPETGVPDKVSQGHLYSLGFKSINDRPIIRILKFIKFLDDSGVPTDRYKKFRDKSKSSAILGSALQEAYSELFKIYPNANDKDTQTLQNFFSTQTGLAASSVKSVVDTFKTMCSLAKIGDLQSQEVNDDIEMNEQDVPLKSSHVVNFALSEGRKVKIIMPEDISGKEIDKLKNLLNAFK